MPADNGTAPRDIAPAAGDGAEPAAWSPRKEAPSWLGKPYHSLDYELKRQFGEKVYKISLNAGLTCPNRDGSLGYGGCIFCSAGGSGEFASPSSLSIRDQIDCGIQRLSRSEKRTGSRYIAYFQAYTNTYAPVEKLKDIYMPALKHPAVAGISIATRPDCLGRDVLTLLSELADTKPVWVELGLQTIHEATASYIRRGYDLACFESALAGCAAHGLPTVAHVIFGLPGENRRQMFETVRYLARRPVQGVKLQLLQILYNTDLYRDYKSHPFSLLTAKQYVSLVVSAIGLLPEDMVIHRLTGDAPRQLLAAPRFSLNKRFVLNSILRECKERDVWQGKYYR